MAESVMTRRETPSRAAGERPIRALVVEDDPSWQQILSEILTDQGLEVDLADQYDVAVEKLRAFSHRLAILDLSLGGTDHHNQDGVRVADSVADRERDSLRALSV